MRNLEDYKFIDIHYHASPDLYIRKLNAIEAGSHYQELEGAVFLTSHLGSTGIQAVLAQSLGLPAFPSLILNSIAGGIDYHVILRALAEYKQGVEVKMLVHFPTMTGRAYQSKLTRQLAHPNLGAEALAGETLFNEQKRLKKNAIDILKMAIDYPIVLSTGHASREETYCLIDACVQYQVPALLLNQPAHPLMGLSAQDLMELTTCDLVWVEQTALTYLLGHQDKEDFSQVLTSLPRVIYSSDLGQPNQMSISAWVAFTKQVFTELKLSSARQDELWRANPLKLLSL